MYRYSSKRIPHHLCLLTLLFVGMGHIKAQFTTAQIESILERNAASIGLHDYYISDEHFNAPAGIHHVYVTPTVNGIPAPEYQKTLALGKDGEIKYISGEAMGLDQISGHTRMPANGPEIAFSSMIAAKLWDSLPAYKKMNRIPWTWRNASDTEWPFLAKMHFVRVKDGHALRWNIEYYDEVSGEWMRALLDEHGQLLSHESMATYCSYEEIRHDSHKSDCLQHDLLGGQAGSYRVFPMPVESPLYGNRSLENMVADPTYSPFGWHDTNGAPGPEHTDLTGNNTKVYLDRSGDYVGEGNTDGGQSLLFDFPFNPNASPTENKDAAATNLFYVVNRTHDILSYLGFDEAAGNFQDLNYTGSGTDGDRIESYYQFGANEPGRANPATINNANFMSPVDGFNGVLRMYVWDRTDRKLLNVLHPPEIAGIYETSIALFGPQVDSDPISAPVVLSDDGVGVITDGCQEIQNDISGKIAIIDRGDCTFGEKVYNAQQAGAVAVIISDNRPGNIQNMQDPTFGPLIDIPSIRVTQQDGSLLKAYIDQGLQIEIVRPELPGADTLDSAFDNGLVIHELGHGLSNRLTAGAARSNCLRNFTYGDTREGEQMGEGWSDYLGIALTQASADLPQRRRTVATYLNKESQDGGGIRPFPYVPDMAANPVTYYDIYDASVPHGVGHVWGSMLWDIHWALTEKYGFNPDLINGDGGNKRALELMIDGLKLQPCDPGFVDGRNALLMADSLRNNGVDQCLLWQQFAKRGLGHGASQGNDRYRRDGKESYDLPPFCRDEVTLTKTSEAIIERGDTYSVRLTVANNTGTDLTNIVITDPIPANNSVREDLLPDYGQVTGGEVEFNLDFLANGESTIISYLLEASNALASEPVMLDDLEDNPLSRWETQSIQGNNPFTLSNANVTSGSNAWKVAGIGETCQQYLLRTASIDVPGDGLPVMRFFHRFDTENGADGGIVEVSADGTQWQDVSDMIFRYPYRNRISVSTFQLVGQQAFTGESNGWKRTYLDLSAFKGQAIQLRFRFGCDYQFSSEGWTIDDIEVFNALQYISQASLTSDQGFTATAENTEYGTIVEPEDIVSLEEETSQNRLKIYPNPVADLLQIGLPDHSTRDVRFYITDIRGSEMRRGQIDLSTGQGALDVRQLSPGTYLIALEIHGQIHRQKFIKL